MMRILYVSDITSVHTMRWVRYMVNHGYEVVVLSVRPGEVKGARVIYLDPGRFQNLPNVLFIYFLTSRVQ